MDLTKRQDVVNLMQNSISEEDWNKRCGQVKVANGGYPNFWYEAIIMSGIMKNTVKKWNG